MRWRCFCCPASARATSIDADDNDELADVHRALAAFGRVTLLLHMADIDAGSDACLDIERVVADLAARIAAAPGETVVVGYSVGGYLAFEACRRAAQAGARIRLLLLIDSSAFFVPPPVRPLAAELLDTLRQGVGKTLLLAPFLAALHYGRLELARRWLVGVRALAGSRRLPGLRVRLLVAYWFRATDRFSLAPYAGPVVLFKAIKARPRIADATLGWAPLAPALRVVAVEGDHWTMLRNPDLLRAIAAELQALGT